VKISLVRRRAVPDRQCLQGVLFVRHAGIAELPLRLVVGADAIDGIRAALESRPAVLEKSAQRGRLAQQH
jgi:hypothetical protein